MDFYTDFIKDSIFLFEVKINMNFIKITEYKCGCTSEDFLDIAKKYNHVCKRHKENPLSRHVKK